MLSSNVTIMMIAGIYLYSLLMVLAVEKCFTTAPSGGGSKPLALTFPLSGEMGTWTAVNSNGSVSVQATVPGTIYTDLMRAGVLSDPYYRFNDLRYRWVAYDNWTYTRTFNVSGEVLAWRSVWLDCHGIDTVARIFINEKLVQSTRIMFHHYKSNIKDTLKEGLNTLTIAFTSPVTDATRRAAAYPYTVPPECPPEVQNGECHVNFLRKEASSFSWDWGPAFPTMGIWKPLYLRGYDTISVQEFTAIPTKDARDHWHVKGSVFFDVSHAEGHDVTEITTYFSIPSILYRKVKANISSSQTSFKYDIIVNGAVSLWWPHTHGAPTLYNLTMAVRTDSGREQLTRRIGFRTVELVQDPIPRAPGLSFYFRVNGHVIFMKGSNWIPADSFHERVTNTYIHRLLTSARDAHMNMLRVWGGGIYEADSFYDIADELGILIWQDLMFACNLYPTDAAFLTETQLEVRQQVRRLMSHPSIVIWAGNNENEAALADNWYNTKTNYALYYKDYVTLYVDTLRPIVMHEDPSRHFITSSPTNGVESDREGWVAKNPHSTLYGDLHYYNYANDSWRWETYPVPRFMSEYGVQSWCSHSALQAVSQPADLTITSTFYEHRQHRSDGNKVLETSVARHLPLPKTDSLEEYFKHFIYLTQIDQAMGMQTESELLRRSQSSLSTEGDGYTMGALYWQLNDIWQAPTWASLEYGGKWKMLHYFAKRFFSQTILSPYLNGTRLIVYYVQDPMPATPTNSDKRASDENRTKKDTQNQVVKTPSNSAREQVFLMRCYSYSSLKPLKIWAVPFLKPLTPAGKVYEADLSRVLKDAGCGGPERCLLHFSLHSDTTAPDTVLLPTYPNKAFGLQPPGIKVTGVVKQGGDDITFKVSLMTRQVAMYVWLDSGTVRGFFSDNGFFMINPTHAVTFELWDDNVTAEMLQAQLTVTSLADVFL